MAKTTIPDGKGGWIEVEGEVHQGVQRTQEQALSKQFESDAHEHMLKVLQFEQTLAQESNRDPQTRAFAMLLLVISMREGKFPGGPEAFDQVNELAYQYYLKNS